VEGGFSCHQRNTATRSLTYVHQTDTHLPFSVESALPLTRSLESGDHAIWYTACTWPLRDVMNLKVKREPKQKLFCLEHLCGCVITTCWHKCCIIRKLPDSIFNTMGNKTRDVVETRLLFHNAAYSKCDVPSEIRHVLHNMLPDVYAMTYIKRQSVSQVVQRTGGLCSRYIR
jgi:hypothetical protein